VYKALVGALETQPPPKTLYIFVDSQAAIQRLHNPGNPTIQKAKGIAETLVRRGIRIHIVWCPSHQGIPGNEIADLQAKRGLQQPPDSEAYTSIGYLRSLARKQVILNWENL